MTHMRKYISVSAVLVSALLIMNAFILNAALTEDKKYYETLLVFIPMLVIATWDLLGKKYADKSQ